MWTFMSKPLIFAASKATAVVKPSSYRLLAARCMSVINLSDGDAVKKFVEQDKAIMYFTATWCPPCKMIGPVYEKLSTKHKEDGIQFGKVDVDDNGDAAMEYSINAVPTFITISGGKIIDRFSGADSGQLDNLIANLKET